MRSKLIPALGGLALGLVAVTVAGCSLPPFASHSAPSLTHAATAPHPRATQTEAAGPTTPPSVEESGTTMPGTPDAADLSTIPGHDLLPPCLPPGFALPEGTQIVQAVDTYGADGPCTTTGGSFRLAFSEPPEVVTAFLRQAYTEPSWQKDYDQGETVKLIANDGAATGPLPAWKLDFLDDPANVNPAVGTYGATFIVFIFRGQTEGQVSYLPPSAETTS